METQRGRRLVSVGVCRNLGGRAVGIGVYEQGIYVLIEDVLQLLPCTAQIEHGVDGRHEDDEGRKESPKKNGEPCQGPLSDRADHDEIGARAEH